ncbi:GlcG/HbpS family heme-binding protein [Aeromicrobium terrae]|uniref:Heme-binding protein n=1 Tax=Aeromicrobium terrae TaxID=2498846 RepID=A0A5C8NJ47_9ACTN|nr:heme-binding protein [Aeromicrobium terrae]TXL61318.1 heme-binding protein [Aeromicrobium terrae]
MLTTTRLDRDDAAVLVDGAREKSVEMGIPMSIAVTDPAGHLILFEQMDGAKVSSIQTAIDKAWTGATARKGTHVYNQLCVPGEPTFGIHNTNSGRFSIIGGGLPVEVDGEVVGGIGISSGTAIQDLEVAEAAVEHFLKVQANQH